MNQGRVIVTYGRSLMSLVIAQSLSRRGVGVIGCDDVDLTVLSFSKHVKETFLHEAYNDEDEDAYFQSLLEGVKKYKPEDDRPYLLMPVFRNTRAISRRRDLFEPYITVAAPDWDSITKVFPKENLVKTAMETGANIPKSIHTTDKKELREALAGFKEPLILKPVAGVGGRGIQTDLTRDSAIDAFEKFQSETGEAPLLQEQVMGDDYCFTGIFKDGELLSHMAYYNLKSFPAKTGAGAVRETIDDTVFIEPAKKLMRGTGWTGVAEIDFLWSGNQNDEPSLIEVNPRFWAGLFHSVKSGIDYPWLMYELFTTGAITEAEEARIGETTKAPGLWLASTVQEIAESNFNFDRLKDAWRGDSNKSLINKIRTLGSAFGDAIDMDDACYRLFESFDLAKNSSDELSDQHDPFAGLGLLFVLSSLARHGRLPEEVKLA